MRTILNENGLHSKILIECSLLNRMIFTDNIKTLAYSTSSHQCFRFKHVFYEIQGRATPQQSRSVFNNLRIADGTACYRPIPP